MKDTAREKRYKKYGITVSQYNAMLAHFGGRCAICKKKPRGKRLAVEHCHVTKRVRGVACFRCNKFIIGRLAAEDAPKLRRAAEYLESSFDARKL